MPVHHALLPLAETGRAGGVGEGFRGRAADLGADLACAAAPWRAAYPNEVVTWRNSPSPGGAVVASPQSSRSLHVNR
jgi:hypothetical protein